MGPKRRMSYGLLLEFASCQQALYMIPAGCCARQFAWWVRKSEPDGLTYEGFTRPKALAEIVSRSIQRVEGYG